MAFSLEKKSPCLQPRRDMDINYLQGDTVGSYSLGKIFTSDYD